MKICPKCRCCSGELPSIILYVRPTDVDSTVTLNGCKGVLVRWGDGTKDVVESKVITHTYKKFDNYVITLYGLTIIPARLLEKNRNVYHVDISETVQFYSASTYAFFGSLLESIKLPENMTYIAPYTFFGCTLLKSIELPKNLKAIPSDLFSGCTSLTSLNIPDSVVSIDQNAFTNSGLKSIVLPDSVVDIAPFAFRNCTSLVSVRLPHGLKILLNYVFMGCSSLVDVYLPEGLTEIWFEAFNSCSSLVSINLPKSLTFLGSGVFYSCRKLKSIVIPSGVTRLSGNSPGGLFQFCTSLMSVTLEFPSVELTGPDGFYGVPNNCLIYIPNGSLSYYELAPNWNTFVGRFVEY